MSHQASQKLKKSKSFSPENRLRFETLLVNLSSTFVNIAPDEIDNKIDESLKEVLEFLDFDRCSLQEFIKGQKKFHATYSYQVEGIKPVPDFIIDKKLPWIASTILGGTPIALFQIPDDFRDQATSEKKVCLEMGLKSAFLIPLEVGGTVIGAITFELFRSRKDRSDEIIQRLKLLGVFFANAIIRKRNKETIDEFLSFERLLSELSINFFNLPVHEVNNKIDSTLKHIMEILRLDRVGLVEFVDRNKKAKLTHSALSPDVEAPFSGLLNDRFHWFSKKMRKGEIVKLENLPDDLPDHAEIERKWGSKYKIKSFLMLPLVIDRKSLGGLVFGTTKFARKWTDGQVRQLKLVSELFANILERKRNDEHLSIALTEIKDLKARLEEEVLYLRKEVELKYEHRTVIGESNVIRNVLNQIEQVASTDSTVLLLGDTGTGKELLAREIHNLSKRKARPMVVVNCAALPATLVESVLFGREKGAYTGATTRQIGRFEIADGSSLFLDEIGELPIDLQVKLLRFLQDGKFERLGSSKTIKVDVRLITATNRDLKKAIQEGAFRQDLYYRLNVFPISVPPLRKRTEDIPALVWAFVKEFGKNMGKHVDNIPQKAMAAMKSYSWPGNVRELRNVIEHALIISKGKTLKVKIPAMSSPETPNNLILDEVVKKHILTVLKKTGWRVKGKNGAAEVLGIKESTLRARLKKLGIQRPDKY